MIRNSTTCQPNESHGNVSPANRTRPEVFTPDRTPNKPARCRAVPWNVVHRASNVAPPSTRDSNDSEHDVREKVIGSLAKQCHRRNLIAGQNRSIYYFVNLIIQGLVLAQNPRPNSRSCDIMINQFCTRVLHQSRPICSCCPVFLQIRMSRIESRIEAVF